MEKQYQVIKPAHGYYGGECLEADISPTIDTGIGCWHTLIGEKMEEVKCNQVGVLTGEKWDKLHEQNRRVYGTDGLSPTMTTMGGGQREVKIIEPNYRFYRQATETLAENDCEYGDTIDAFNKRVNKDGVSPTLTTRPEGLKTAILPVTKDYRIRKLTERECFRLMGVKESDFEKVAKNQSMSSLYHCAGDSIVTTCLMAIFGELFDCDYQEKINSLVEELRK